MAEQRSKRTVLFENDSLLKSYAKKGITDFQPFGLPQNLKVLFPNGLTSFDLNGVQGVRHGGPTIEEAVVPVVELCR